MVSLSLTIATLLVAINCVYVHANITIEPNYNILYIVQPSELNLTCRSEDTNTLEWYKGTSKAKDIGFKTSNKYDLDTSGNQVMSVTISKASTSPADNGEYKCQSDSSERTLTITVLTQNPAHAEYNKSMNAAILVCGLNADRSLYTLHWEFKGKELQEDEKYKLYTSNGTLIIKNPEHSDSGRYTCVYSFHNSGNQALKVPLNFYASPYVKKFDKSKNLIQGDPLTLRCEVYSYPQATISWRKDDKPIVDNDRIQILTDDKSGLENGMLKIKEVEFDDKGTYMCYVTSTYFNMSSNRTIVVRVKDKLAALWPFLGIVAEVIVLCIIIFIYEKKRSRSEDEDADADAGNCANAADHKGKDEVRQRNVRA